MFRAVPVLLNTHELASSFGVENLATYSAVLGQSSYFNCAGSSSRNSRGDLVCFFNCFNFDEKVASELFFRFRERAVDGQCFAIPHAYAIGRGGWSQLGAAQKYAVVSKLFS